MRTPAQSRKALAAAFGTIGKAYLLAQSILLEIDAEQAVAREQPPTPPPSKPARSRSTLLDPVEPREPVPLNGKGHHNDELTKMERKILTALAQAGKTLTNPQIGVRIGGSARGGAFNSTMTELRKAGYINSAGGESDITIDGRQALGPFTPLPTGPDLFEYWVAKVGTMGGKILNALRTAHVRRDGRPQTKESIGIDACVSSGGGAFNGALTKLRKLELIVDVSGGILLSEDLRRAAEPTVEVYDRSSRTSQRVSARTGLPVQS